MSKLRNIIVIGLLAAVTVLGLYGCGGSEPTATPLVVPTDTVALPTETPMQAPATSAAPEATTANSGTTDTGGATGTLTGPAADLLNKSQAAMKTVKSFHYTMDVETSGGGQAFKGEGDFVMPDNVRISMSDTMGTIGKIDMVMIGSDTYMKQPGSDQYISLGAVGGANGLPGLNNPAQTASIAQFADSASIVGDEKVDGVDTTHVTFTYDVDKAMKAAEQQASNAVGTAPTPTKMKAKGDIWIDKSTNYIHKMVFVTKSTVPVPQGSPATGDSTITLVYSKFNEPVTPPIEKPANVTTMPGNVGTPVP